MGVQDPSGSGSRPRHELVGGEGTEVPPRGGQGPGGHALRPGQLAASPGHPGRDILASPVKRI